jgi:hypothetical protein
LGVLLEMKEDLLQAQKMYRAALSLDPTYAPANENLHRTVTWDYSKENPNFGEMTDPTLTEKK